KRPHYKGNDEDDNRHINKQRGMEQIVRNPGGSRIQTKKRYSQHTGADVQGRFCIHPLSSTPAIRYPCTLHLFHHCAIRRERSSSNKNKSLARRSKFHRERWQYKRRGGGGGKSHTSVD